MRYLSESFLTLIGQTEEEAQGLGWVEALAPETAEADAARLADRSRGPASWSFEFTVRGTDGRSHTILSRASRFVRATGGSRAGRASTSRHRPPGWRRPSGGVRRHPVRHALRTPITRSTWQARCCAVPAWRISRAELLDDISQESSGCDGWSRILSCSPGSNAGRSRFGPSRSCCARCCAGGREEQVAGRQAIDSRWWATCRLPRPSGLRRADRAQLIGNAAKYGPPTAGSRSSPMLRMDIRACVSSIGGPGVDPNEATGFSSSSTGPSARPGPRGRGSGLFLAHRWLRVDGRHDLGAAARRRSGSDFGFTLQALDEDA